MYQIIEDYPILNQSKNYYNGLIENDFSNNNYNVQHFSYQNNQNRIKSTENLINLIKKSFLEEIDKKANDYFNEYFVFNEDLINSNFSDFRKIYLSINTCYRKSIDNVTTFIELMGISFISSFKPDINFDDDGEIIFEWYGRKGVRVNLTFGKNGEIYFVSLFHGQSLKSKLFTNDNTINLIKNELVKLFKDKVL